MAGDLQQQLARYKDAPGTFTPYEVSQLSKRASMYGVDITDYDEPGAFDEVPKQLFGGLIQGYVLADPVDAPKTYWGQMARGIGHLMGFVGQLWPGVGITKAITSPLKLAGNLARGTKAGVLAGRIAGAESLQAFRSVPMYAADKGVAFLAKQKAGIAVTKYLVDKPVLEQMVGGGLHLGIASAVSGAQEDWRGSWQSGIANSLKSAAWGGIFGGVFGAIGNTKLLREYTTLNRMVKGVMGAAVQGGPPAIESAMSDEENKIPIPTLVEQFLLGAYFGSQSVHANKYKAFEIIKGTPKGSKPQHHASAENPLYDALSPERKAEIDVEIAEVFKPIPAWTFFHRVLMGLPGSHKLTDAYKLETLQVGDRIQDPESKMRGKVIEVIKEAVEGKKPGFMVQNENTGAAEFIPARRAELFDLAQEPLIPPDQLIDMTRTSPDRGIEDYDMPMLPESRRKLARQLMGRVDVTSRELEALTHNMGKKLEEIVREGSESAWVDYKAYLDKISVAETGKPMDEVTEGVLGANFDASALSLVQHHRFVGRDGKTHKYKIAGDGGYRDVDHNRRNAISPMKHIQIVNPNVKDIYYEVTGIANGEGGKILNSLASADFTPKMWQNLVKGSLEEGYYPLGGWGDHPKFIFVKFANNEKGAARILEFIRRQDPKADAKIQKWADLAAKNWGLSKEAYLNMYTSNALHIEKLYGMPIEEWYGKDGFVNGPLDFNKRLQILFTDYLPLNPLRWKGGKINYAVVEDYSDTTVKDLAEEYLGKEASDGATLITRAFAEKLWKFMGLPSGGGFGKPFLISQSKSLGTLLGKTAFHVVDGPLSKEMERLGLDMIMHKSSAKQWGKREISALDWTADGKLTFNDGAPVRYQMEPQDIRMSRSVYDDPAAIKKGIARLAKQLLTNLAGKNHKVYTDYLRENAAGDPIANDALKSWLDMEKGTQREEVLKSLIEQHMETLGLQDILSAMSTDKGFREAARRYILFRDREDYDVVDMIADWDTEGTIDPTSLQRTTAILDFLKFGQATDGPALNKLSRNVMESQMVSFFVRRVTRPKIHGAIKAVMRTFDIKMQKDFTLGKNDFMLDDYLKEMPVFGIMEGGKRVWTTLGKQEEFYKTLPGRAREARPEENMAETTGKHDTHQNDYFTKRLLEDYKEKQARYDKFAGPTLEHVFPSAEARREHITSTMDFLVRKFGGDPIKGVKWQFVDTKDTTWKSRYDPQSDTIEINATHGDLRTSDLWHEVAHPFIERMLVKNPTTFLRISEELEKLPEYREILHYAQARVSRLYPETYGNRLLRQEEILSHIFGWEAAKRAKGETIGAKIKRVIKMIYDALLGKSTDEPLFAQTVHLEDFNEKTTLEDVLKAFSDVDTEVPLDAVRSPSTRALEVLQAEQGNEGFALAEEGIPSTDTDLPPLPYERYTPTEQDFADLLSGNVLSEAQHIQKKLSFKRKGDKGYRPRLATILRAVEEARSAAEEAQAGGVGRKRVPRAKPTPKLEAADVPMTFRMTEMFREEPKGIFALNDASFPFQNLSKMNKTLWSQFVASQAYDPTIKGRKSLTGEEMATRFEAYARKEFGLVTSHGKGSEHVYKLPFKLTQAEAEEEILNGYGALQTATSLQQTIVRYNFTDMGKKNVYNVRHQFEFPTEEGSVTGNSLWWYNAVNTPDGRRLLFETQSDILNKLREVAVQERLETNLLGGGGEKQDLENMRGRAEREIALFAKRQVAVGMAYKFHGKPTKSDISRWHTIVDHVAAYEDPFYAEDPGAVMAWRDQLGHLLGGDPRDPQNQELVAQNVNAERESYAGALGHYMMRQGRTMEEILPTVKKRLIKLFHFQDAPFEKVDSKYLTEVIQEFGNQFADRERSIAGMAQRGDLTEGYYDHAGRLITPAQHLKNLKSMSFRYMANSVRKVQELRKNVRSQERLWKVTMEATREFANDIQSEISERRRGLMTGMAQHKMELIAEAKEGAMKPMDLIGEMAGTTKMFDHSLRHFFIQEKAAGRDKAYLPVGETSNFIEGNRMAEGIYRSKDELDRAKPYTKAQVLAKAVEKFANSEESARDLWARIEAMPDNPSAYKYSIRRAVQFGNIDDATRLIGEFLQGESPQHPDWVAFRDEMMTRLEGTKPANTGPFYNALSKIKGVTYTEVQKPWMKTRMLEVDLTNYNEESIVRFSKSDTVSEVNDKALARRIEDEVFRMIGLRVPMDALSGAASMNFRGFTGHQAGGIVLHTDAMKRLGGADLDIDSAFLYSGMPKGLHKILQENQDSFAQLHSPDGLTPFAKELFVRENPEIGGDLNDPTATFSPLHLLNIGHQVSKGRNQMLQVAVSNRAFINALYARVMQDNGSALMLHSSNEHLQYRFITKQENELLLEGVGSGAIQQSADIGKRGGMVEVDEMKAMLYRAAFDKIEETNLLTGEVRDILAGSSIDAKTPNLPYEKRRTITPELLQFVSKEVYGIDEIARFRDADQKLYGKDYQNQKAWSFPEMQHAASRFPEKWDVPQKAVANIIAGLEYNDRLLWRFLDSPDRAEALFSEIATVAKAKVNVKVVQPDGSVVEERQSRYPFLPGGFHLPYKQLVAEMNLLGSFYRAGDVTSEGNIWTYRGAREIASMGGEWAKFSEQYAKIQGYVSWEQFVNVRAKAKGAEYLEAAKRDMPTTVKAAEAYLKAAQRTAQQVERSEKYKLFTRSPKPGDDVLYERTKFIQDFINRTEDFISTRLEDMAGLKMVQHFFDKSGLTPGEAKAIYAELIDLKSEYSSYWLQRRDQGRINESAGSLEKILDQYNSIRRTYVTRLTGPAAAGRNLGEEAIGDFIDAAFLSPFLKGTKTAFNRLGLEIANPKIINRFARELDNALTLTQTPYKRGQGANWLETAKNDDLIVGAGPREEALNFGIVIPEGIDLNSPITKEAEVMVHEALAYLKEIPNYTAETFVNMLREKLGVAQLSDLTIYDVDGLMYDLRALRRGTGVMNFLFGPKADSKVAFRWWHTLQYVGHTADLLKRDDLTFLTTRIINDDGTMKDPRELRKLTHINTLSQRLETVYANTAQGMSTFGRIIEEVNHHEGHTSQIDAYMAKKIDNQMGYIARGIRRPGSATNEGPELLTTAITYRESNGAELMLSDARQKLLNAANQPKHVVERLEERVKRLSLELTMYQARDASRNAHYTLVKNQLFDVMSPGRVERMTGGELIEKMKQDLQTLFEEGYEKHMKFRPEWAEENLPLRNDGTGRMIIDLPKAYEGTRRFREQIFVDPDKLTLTHDESAFMPYFDKVFYTARDMAKHEKPPTQQEILGRRWGPMAEMLTYFPETSKMTNSELKQYLWGYSRATDKDADIGQLLRHVETSPIAKRGVERARADHTKDTGREKALAVRGYFSKTLHEYDVRRIIYKINKYSQYENDLAWSQGRISARDYFTHKLMNESTYRMTGKHEGYWPHYDYSKQAMNVFENETLRKLETQRLDGVIDDATYYQRVAEMHTAASNITAEDRDASGGLNNAIRNEIIQEGSDKYLERVSASVKALDDLGGGHKPSSTMRRSSNMDGYSTRLNMTNKYFSKLSHATMRNLSAWQANRLIQGMLEKQPHGKYTKTWANWYRLYVRDAIGGASLLSKEIVNDKYMNILSTPYGWFSDHMAFSKFSQAEKLAKRLFGFAHLADAELAHFRQKNKRVPTEAEKKELLAERWEKFKESGVGQDALANKLRWFSSLEGKFEMATLLFHSKTAMTNMLGGSVNNWVWTGSRHMWNARKLETFRQINPEWRSMTDVHNAVALTGAVEEFIIYEGSLVNPRGKAGWDSFFGDVVNKLKKDPSMNNEKLFSLGKKHGIGEDFIRKSAWFMLESERWLRTNAFLSSYLQARESMEPLSRLDWDTPFLIEAGKKGIAATQFLYSNANRPAFARTNLGKVYTRFKLWSWSSVKFRNQVYHEAESMGYRPGSVEFERMQRLIIADLFAVGLVGLLPYTIFDYSLPAPLSYFQNLADWMFGNSKERERAFFASNVGLPAALAPLNEFLPPIARLGKGIWDVPSTFSLLWSGDIQRVAEFTTYSLFPGGRMSKDVFKSLQQPTGVLDFLAGVPLRNLGRLVKKKRSRGQFNITMP